VTRDTLEWLRWLVASQSVQIGADGAMEQAGAAWRALSELDAAIAASA